MIQFGVIGYGYWGPNVVRNLMEIKETKVRRVCDLNPEVLSKVNKTYPHLEITTSADDIFNDHTIGAVAIVTPVKTHYDLARKALENGKHIFVEKPFMSSCWEAEEVIRLAEKKQRKIMVDHTFLFTGAVQKIKEILDRGDLGDLCYFDSIRVSLGNIQPDVNVIWDLAPHDFSIMDYVLNMKPKSITAQGVDHLGQGRENIAYVTMHFEKDFIAHISVNWLSPLKVRTTMIGGMAKMLVWDDLETDEKIKVYDKSVSVESGKGMYSRMVDYRSGDMWSPHVDQMEALKRELVYFSDCIERNETPINDGQAGLRVVKMLEASDKSLRGQGKLVRV